MVVVGIGDGYRPFSPAWPYSAAGDYSAHERRAAVATATQSARLRAAMQERHTLGQQPLKRSHSMPLRKPWHEMGMPHNTRESWEQRVQHRQRWLEATETKGKAVMQQRHTRDTTSAAPTHLTWESPVHAQKSTPPAGTQPIATAWRIQTATPVTYESAIGDIIAAARPIPVARPLTSPQIAWFQVDTGARRPTLERLRVLRGGGGLMDLPDVDVPLPHSRGDVKLSNRKLDFGESSTCVLSFDGGPAQAPAGRLV